MNTLIFPLLLGAGPSAGGAAGTGGGSSWMTFLPIVGMIAIFYFLIIRPQNKKQKDTQKMLSALKKGDKVVTIGGLHGTIQSVKESTVIIRVDDNCRLEFSRSAISGVEAVAKEDKTESKEEEKPESAGSAENTDK
ncbi:MAG: preprotein translocase subunit YajC [Treponema sp.]|jgi:preprotein translocase subunit YajC|nr:preprotein translocase subunit YajC [Treponema sp.]